MTPTTERALNAYSALEVETGVTNASPQRLVIMLYDGALKATFAAKAAILHGDTAAKGEAISKAISIIDEGLRAALDQEAGGEIAANLAALYDYIASRLLYANLKNDQGSLDECARLLSELRGAWEELEQRSRPVEAMVPVAPPEARAPVSFGKV
jgi:flagellar protein FliS